MTPKEFEHYREIYLNTYWPLPEAGFQLAYKMINEHADHIDPKIFEPNGINQFLDEQEGTEMSSQEEKIEDYVLDQFHLVRKEIDDSISNRPRKRNKKVVPFELAWFVWKKTKDSNNTAIRGVAEIVGNTTLAVVQPIIEGANEMGETVANMTKDAATASKEWFTNVKDSLTGFYSAW
uniref:Uncharacterized protein n=1 Tax=Acrobeloides nanus TaxID=290746 RepID=A0A914DJT7_9BILA